jgi:cytochrome oxidase Cu insertion factor (SCO1/SenC/PrrC family)
MPRNRLIAIASILTVLSLVVIFSPFSNRVPAKTDPSLGGNSTLSPASPADIGKLMASLQIQPVERIDVPNFSLKDINNVRFHVEDHKGKVILLNFWATW